MFGLKDLTVDTVIDIDVDSIARVSAVKLGCRQHNFNPHRRCSNLDFGAIFHLASSLVTPFTWHRDFGRNIHHMWLLKTIFQCFPCS